MDRYEKLVEVLSEKKGVLSADDGMGFSIMYQLKKQNPMKRAEHIQHNGLQFMILQMQNC